MNLNDVLNRRLCLQQPVPACGLIHGCVTMLSNRQGCELFDFVLILYLRHNVRESSIHSQWRSYPLDLVDKSRDGTLLEGGKM